MTPLPPGSIIGIVGGGQLGRMLALAGAPLGYRCHIYCPETAAPAAEVAAFHTRGAYDDTAQLEDFARQVAVATYEFENIPAAAVEVLSRYTAVAPDAAALRVAQDRLAEKEFATSLDIATAPYCAVDAPLTPEATRHAALLPGILKTRRFGYDGKGQVSVATLADLAPAHEVLASAPAVLEKKIDFAGEISLIVARDAEGKSACYAPVWNEHRNHILHRSTVPAPISAEVQTQAVEIAGKVADALNYVGVLAIEMFLTKNQKLILNELAPRVHNSGHWSLEGAVTDQFQQHIRAIAGLPLGAPDLLGESEMINLIGTDAAQAFTYLEAPQTHLHLYGKAEIRPGRKMGHITRITAFTK